MPPAPDRAGDNFNILVVCTANQCRSPMGEAMLRRAQLRRSLGWRIGSAGTDAVDGMPVYPLSAEALAADGLSLPGFASRQLRAELIEDADLILTATVEHRREVVRLAPRAVGRTFPLLQFARFAERVPSLGKRPGPLAGRELLDAVRIARSGVQPVAAGADDIADPVGKPLRVHRACAQTIATAVETSLRPLLP